MKIKLNHISSLPPQNMKKEDCKEDLKNWSKELDILQNRLIAQSKHAVLIILQGLDASGKDGAIKSVFSGFNPMGIAVKAFKKPSEEELKHDYLWRVHHSAPQRGMIKIFNRSHYEDILVPSVENWIDDSQINLRYKQISNFEQYLIENHTHILKFYLHCSDEERLSRLEERKTDPEKFWKYNEGDMLVYEKREVYKEVYEQIFEHTSEPVPWQIVPSDKNWYKEWFIAHEVRKLLSQLHGPL